MKARKITLDMKLAAAEAIANLIPEFELTPDHIIPSSLDTRVPVVVAKAVAEKALQNGQARKKITSAQVEENISTYIIERSLKRLKEKK